MKTKIFKTIKTALLIMAGSFAMIVYCPIYILGWVLHKVLRFLLALSYFMMFEWRMGVDIIKYLFKRHG